MTDVIVLQNLTVENYKQFLDQTVVDKINEYLEENFFIDDMIDFIDDYGTDAFLNHYNTYVELGENYSYGAVDAFIDEFGFELLSEDHFQNSYEGAYVSGAEFAEQHYENMGYDPIPSWVTVDWEATWDRCLSYDCTFNNGYVFKSNW